jgi:class 3 adenylate cyclase
LDIGQWLRDLGLQSYEQAFRDHKVDLDVLGRLTAEDLKEIGVSAVGHRRKILDAVGGLGAALPLAADRKISQRAERRHLTVMFCDLVGSTALSACLDPEDLRELLRTYFARVDDVAGRHGGFVAKYLGDGALIYFGYPQAHEDDTERAVRAGLALIDAVSALTAAGERLSARVGIATGLVVIGDLVGTGEAQERAIAGETPNLAARLQGLAENGTVVIAETTRRIVGDLFELSALAPCSLKGFGAPVLAWRVIGEGNAASRFEALHGTRVTPLVGREEELDLVLSRWRQVKEGGGHVALISGEPGIGKSRLVLALRERLQEETKASLSFACSPHHANSAFFPFITQLERAAEFAPDETAQASLEKLDSLFRRTAATPENAVAVLADLLGIHAGLQHGLAAMSPLQRKGLLFGAFLAQFEGLALQGPVLVMLEDAHWLDPTSRELFDQMVERLQRLPVLLVVTFRPELPPPWTGFPHVTLLTLNRLAQAQARSLVERLTGAKTLPREVLEQILARTEGVPLFAEELTKAILESGLLEDAGDSYVLERPLPPLAIPTTLHDSLMSRLDRLGPAKEIAQIGACIGREFDHDLLAAVVPLPEPISRLRSIDWSPPNSSSAAAFLRRLPTSSSTPWCVMPPIRACFGRAAKTCMPGSPPRLKKDFLTPLKPDRSWSPAILTRRDSSRKRPNTGWRRASWRSLARPTWNRSLICERDSRVFQRLLRVSRARDGSYPCNWRSAVRFWLRRGLHRAKRRLSMSVPRN